MKILRNVIRLTCLLVAGAHPAALAAGTPASTNLVLNFRGAALDSIVDKLAEAAGYSVIRETELKGAADLWTSHVVSADEALDLLLSVLIRNGYAAIRSGNTLTIVNRDQAKTRAIPVRLGSDPANIPDTAEIVTQIIPVRFLEVNALSKDLQIVISAQTAMTADESANAIIITDVQSAIRRVAQVIKALDEHAEDLTVVRVFRLKNADPQEIADQLSQLFAATGTSQEDQTSPRFDGGGPLGGPGAPGPGGFPGGPGEMSFQGSGAGSSGSSRLKKTARVVAVADQRTYSVVVSAPQQLIDQVEEIVSNLDASAARKQTVRMLHFSNATPAQVKSVLAELFQKEATTSTANSASQTQADALQSRMTTQSQSQSSGSTRSGTAGNSSPSGLGGSSGAGAVGGSAP